MTDRPEDRPPQVTDAVPSSVPAPADEGEPEGLPIGLFLLTAGLGLLILIDFVTGGRELPWLGWRPAYLAAVVGGTRVTFASLSGLLDGEIGADFALALATWAALYVGEPFAAAEVVFIAMTGESLEEVAFARTRKALERLLNLWPTTATKLVDGVEVEVPTDELVVGDRVLVRPGERVPVDGMIVHGASSLDESSLTGESVPVDKAIGDPVSSGTQNLYGAIQVTAARVGAETTLGQVCRLVEQAEEQKAPVERTADLYARYFLPVVLACALLTWLVSRDLIRTVAVLVVACPCALVLATPAAVIAGIGRLARHGVLVKGGETLEQMARIQTIGFDKTGTLTQAKLELVEVRPIADLTRDAVLRLAAIAESGSEHPLARLITDSAEAEGLPVDLPATVKERPGAGLVADSPEGRLAVGNTRLMEQLGIDVGEVVLATVDELAAAGQTVVLVARDSQVIGAIGARDRLRDDAPAVIAELRRLGIRRIALLTGDRQPVAAMVAEAVGVDEVHAEQLPTDKADWVRRLRQQGDRVAMVGDGINDAPALAQADVGVAVAETGSDIAAEAADIVLLGDPLAQVPLLVQLCRQVLGTIKLSIIGFAFGLNGLAVLLSAFGKLTPVQAAVFHQVGSLAVLLNSLRLLGFEQRTEAAWARPLVWARRGLELVLSIDFDGLVTWLAVRWRVLVRGVAAVAAGLWAASCLVPVGPDQVAVVRVLGRHVATYGPGLAVKPWWPVGRATLLRPLEVRVVEIGFRSRDRGDWSLLAPGQYDWNSAHQAGAYERLVDEALMLTGEEDFVEVQAVVQYDVTQPARFVFVASGVEDLLASMAESALREVVAQTANDVILTDGRHAVEEATRRRLAADCRDLRLGVRILGVELGDVHPPLEVVPAFRNVSSAFEHKLQQVNEAEAYSRQEIPRARGEAHARREEAAADRDSRRLRASGDASRFQSREQAYRAAPGVTSTRLHLETVERVLADRRKLVLDPQVTGRRQFWTIDPALARLLEALGQPIPVDSLPPLPTEEEEEEAMLRAQPQQPATLPDGSNAVVAPTSPPADQRPTTPGVEP